MLARLDVKNYSDDSDGQDFEKDSTLPTGVGTFTIQWQRIDGPPAPYLQEKRPRIFQTRHICFAGWQTAGAATMGLGRTDGKPFDFSVVFESGVFEKE